MTKQPIISVSGLRGVVGESLTTDVASRYACALAATLSPGRLVITRDGRATGQMFADAIRAGLTAVGRDVIDAGVAATPTTGVLIRKLGAAGGVQISASHNPAEYNGMKLFGGDGRVVPAIIGEQVLDRYAAGVAEWKPHDRIGKVFPCIDPHAEHLAAVLAQVDVEIIRAARFTVLLDSNHGAGGLLGARLLESLGCTVIHLGAEPHGEFAHTPEPTAENLASVCEHVSKHAAAVGFCQDPDADRLALIDERGRYIGEEYTLAICVADVLRRVSGPIVTNCSTSRMSRDLAEQFGVPFYCSKVGEANVVDEMLAQGAVFGGEGNGGPIDPRVGYVRDSFVGMALVLNAMANRMSSLSGLVAEIPRYEIHKAKVHLPLDVVPQAIRLLRSHFSTAEPSVQDGLRLDWPDRWLLVRGSNTEPVVRLIAEAKDLSVATALCEEAQAVIHLLADRS